MRGNHALFIVLVSCSAVAAFGVLLPLIVAGAYFLREHLVALVALAGLAVVLLYLASQAAMWFFYGRHAHLRAGIKSSQD